MCCRLAFDPDDYIYPRFGLTKKELIKPHFNISPQQNVFVITNDGIKNKLQTMRWGLVPFWSKDEKIAYKTINARVESISEKASYRNSFVSKRCIIPASGFYEWQKSDKNKIPYFIKEKGSKYISLAGLYDSWKDQSGKELQTFTIITLPANSQMIPIHERMPALLDKENEQAWLNSKISDKDLLLNILHEAGDVEFDMHQVSTQVNNPKNDSPDLIKSPLFFNFHTTN